MRIVFMGTPDFAAASLKKLIDEKRDVVGVFTQPDKPKGRGMELAASRWSRIFSSSWPTGASCRTIFWRCRSTGR